jgi:hypothetical protein
VSRGRGEREDGRRTGVGLSVLREAGADQGRSGKSLDGPRTGSPPALWDGRARTRTDLNDEDDLDAGVCAAPDPDAILAALLLGSPGSWRVRRRVGQEVRRAVDRPKNVNLGRLKLLGARDGHAVGARGSSGCEGVGFRRVRLLTTGARADEGRRGKARTARRKSRLRRPWRNVEARRDVGGEAGRTR